MHLRSSESSSATMQMVLSVGLLQAPGHQRLCPCALRVSAAQVVQCAGKW